MPLSITLPTSKSDDGVWGDKLNANLQQVVTYINLLEVKANNTAATVATILDPSTGKLRTSILPDAPSVAPAAPTLTATASGGTVSVSWTAVTGAATYRLSKNGIVAYEGANLTYTDNSLANGDTPTYVVYAVNATKQVSNASNAQQLTITTSAGSGVPDLVILGVSPSIASPKAGDQVLFTALVKNQGTGPTPANTTIGIGYYPSSGGVLAVADSYNTSIPAGASVSIPANAPWTAASGTTSITAFVDDINRIQNEVSESNNTFNFTVTATAVAGTPGTGGSGTVDTPVSSAVGTVVPSWVGATNAGGGFDDSGAYRMTHSANSAYVDSSGKTYLASNWDEHADELSMLNPDGSVPGRFNNAHTSPAGYAVTVSGSNIWWGDRDGFRLYSSNTFGAVSLPGNGSGEFNSVRGVSGGDQKVRGLAVIGTEIFVHQDDNKVHVYSTSDYSEKRSWATGTARFNDMVVVNGRLAILTGSGTLTYYDVNGGSQGTITGLVDPQGLALDDQNATRVGVCLGTGDHRVVFFDYNSGSINAATATPAKTLGVKGGIMSTSGSPRGNAVDKQRFYYPRFTRILSDGSYIVVMYTSYPQPEPEAGGVIVRRFGADNSLTWENNAMIFCDSAFIDPDDPNSMYTVRDRFTVSHSANTTTPGKGWSIAAHTLDPTVNGADPRILDGHGAASPQIRTLSGVKIMVTVGMYGDAGVSVYKRDGDTWVYVTNLGGGGWGQWLAKDGTYWRGAGDHITKRPFAGFDTGGAPTWGTEQTWYRPGSGAGSDWQDIRRAQYDSDNDVMYVSGFTTGNGNPGINDLEKTIGKVIRRYNSWSSKGLAQAAAWETVVPYSYGPTGGDGKVWIRQIYVPMGMYQDSDFIFTADMAYGLVRAYRKSTGALVQSWNAAGKDPNAAQPAVGDATNPLRFNLARDVSMPGVGVCDIPNCISATKLPDGRYGITVEDNGSPKIVTYYWTPVAA